ncbi:uncharacterized protein RAG0_14579 [Rhynchosporium agropyri]|uniref:NB-ARC domain-containing protein n=1 Tax=Rhynchosporium agropyri TaxID=914238 RepID=A0A1E1LHK8_9HELO|nr:uncharacterized protein RAG0_14579 [Rhynchosporium agropyri]
MSDENEAAGISENEASCSAASALDELDTTDETEDDDRPYGRTEWAKGQDPDVDIVSIHGLNGHRKKTWTASNGALWPSDLYRTISDHSETKSLYETIPLKVKGFCGIIVNKSSAIIQSQRDAEEIELHKNHQDMVRMKSKGDVDYSVITATIEFMCKSAASAIERRWETFDKQEIMGIPKDPVTIIEDGFRANLRELYELLTASGDGSEEESPTAVVLLGIGGHLGLGYLINADGQVTFDHHTRHSVVKALMGWFSLPRNPGWLLIFDNVDDLESVNVGDFFPTVAKNRMILITTRRRECTRFGVELELDILDEDESIRLLQRSCQHKQPFKDAELAQARELVERLCRLPLAIDQAGAYLQVVRRPVSSYLPLLHPNKMKDTLSQKPPSAVWSYEESDFITWEVSFLEIQRTNARSAEILTLCSFFSFAEIQPQMLEKGLEAIYRETVNVDNYIQPLISFCLIARKLSPDAMASEDFSIHRLVHEWARERLPLDEKTRMLRKACTLLCSSLRSCEIWTTGVYEPEDWHYERQVTPHIESIVHWLKTIPEAGNSQDLTSQFISLANVYYYEGRYMNAETLYLRALTQRERTLGSDHESVLEVLQGLATVNRFQGKWDDSERLYKCALQGRQKVDPNGLDTLATVQSLAVLYRHRGRLQECVELNRWALYGDKGKGNGIESQQGKQHPNTIHTILGYAIALQHQGNYPHALSLYEEVIDQRSSRLGPAHPDTLTAKHNQGDLLRCLGNLDKAEIVFGKALDARERHLGPEYPDTLRTYDGLGNVYRDKKMWVKAALLYAQALNGREQKLGFNHADTIGTAHHIATSLRMQGRLIEAKNLYLHVLNVREKDHCLGPEFKHSPTNRRPWIDC